MGGFWRCKVMQTNKSFRLARRGDSERHLASIGRSRRSKEDSRTGVLLLLVIVLVLFAMPLQSCSESGSAQPASLAPDVQAKLNSETTKADAASVTVPASRHA